MGYRHRDETAGRAALRLRLRRVLLASLRLVCPLLVVLIAAAALTLPAHSAARDVADTAVQAGSTGTGSPVSLRGEVIETGCFVIGGRHGPRHRQCAIACARAGQDLAILDEETGLLLIEIRDQREGRVPSALLPHVARRVEVQGHRLERGGLAGIRINQIRALDPPPN